MARQLIPVEWRYGEYEIDYVPKREGRYGVYYTTGQEWLKEAPSLKAACELADAHAKRVEEFYEKDPTF